MWAFLEEVGEKISPTAHLLTKREKTHIIHFEDSFANNAGGFNS